VESAKCELLVIRRRKERYHYAAVYQSPVSDTTPISGGLDVAQRAF
jgi:hypothetical protein